MEIVNVYVDIFNGTYQLFNQIDGHTFFNDFFNCLIKLFYRNNFFLIEIISLSLAIWIHSIGRHLFTIHIIDKFVKNEIIHEKYRKRFIRFGWNFIMIMLSVAISWKFNTDTGCLKNLSLLWSDYNKIDKSLPFLYLAGILIHTSYYLYSSYALIYHDERDKDLIVFLIHHMIVIIIATTSYMVGKTYLTSAVGFLLELNELIVSLKILLKLQLQFIKNNVNLIRLLLLSILTIFWFQNRLFIYPYIVLESLQFLQQSCGQSDWNSIYIFIYFLYFFIFTINFHWTWIIINATFRTFQNGLTNIEDDREIVAEGENENFDSIKMSTNNNDNDDYNKNNNNSIKC